MSKAGFSIADLQQGAKKLNNVEQPAESKIQTGAKSVSEEETQPLEELYEKHHGDLDAM